MATHLAVKWGLEKEKAEKLLDLALERKNATHHEEKTGIGWGMKTIGKFYPEIYQDRSLEKGQGLPAWMASKVKKGMALSQIHKAKLSQKKG